MKVVAILLSTLALCISLSVDSAYAACGKNCNDKCGCKRTIWGQLSCDQFCRAQCEAANLVCNATGIALPHVPTLLQIIGESCSAGFEAITKTVIQAQPSYPEGSNRSIDVAKDDLVDLGLFARTEFSSVNVRWCRLWTGSKGMAPDRNFVCISDEFLHTDGRVGLTATLAHEMIHVRQYRKMGSRDFKCEYSKRFLTCLGCQDNGHPFEKEAYEFEKAATPLIRQHIGVDAIAQKAVIAAEFADGLNVGRGPLPDQYGHVLMNGPPFTARPNRARYFLDFEEAGAYKMFVQYASRDPRPIDIIVNNRMAIKPALAETTGEYGIANQRWKFVGYIRVSAGTNEIVLWRDAVFPHIYQIRFALDKNTKMPPVGPHVPQEIVIRGIDYLSGVNVARAPKPAEYGQVVMNGPPFNDRPNSATYLVRVVTGGKFSLSIRVASRDPRPVDVLFYGDLEKPNEPKTFSGALNVRTGGFDFQHQKLIHVGEVDLLPGDNYLKIDRRSVFPHISEIYLSEIP